LRRRGAPGRDLGRRRQHGRLTQQFIGRDLGGNASCSASTRKAVSVGADAAVMGTLGQQDAVGESPARVGFSTCLGRTAKGIPSHTIQ
jgi:hypothetical protein